MSEPQARSTLGTCWRTSRAPLPSVRPFAVRCSIAIVSVASTLIALTTIATPLPAQIRGGRAPASSAPSTWWLSGGAGASVITDVNDGATQSTWRFGSDPRWTARGSIEKAIDDFTTIGVAASYGKVDVTISRFVLSQAPVPTSGATTAPSPLPASCVAGCAAQTQLWTLMGQFRSGGGSGFHTLFEANGGVTGFRNMRTKDSVSVAIGKPGGAIDLTGTLGAGFGYPITRGMVIALVQDFGIGFHTKTDLPSGTGRSWRVRTTRASLRFRF